MADDNTSNSSGDASGVPNSPKLDASLQPRVRAIKDDKQLSELITKFETENRERNVKNARIMSKYNAERPHRPRDLEAEGLTWMSNFASQPLSTLIDRVAPRFSRAVHAARYLTSAKLPEHVEGAAAKTEKFRKEFTELVRNRNDWKDLVSEIAQENSLFGYTCAAYTDNLCWFPKHFRQDEFYVPAGTKQNPGNCSMLVLKETYLPHELFELISDKESAAEVGWDIDNTVKAINDATPESPSKSFSDSARKFEDLQRESNLYSSLATGAKVIVAHHAFVVEVTGKVSHYILDSKQKKFLFKQEDRFDSMRQVASFFSFQQANGKLQASKGVGRTVYALAGIVDRSRNEVVNRLQLSGKIILQGDDKQTRQFKMSVVGQAIVISKSFSIVQQKIDAGVEPFMQLDNWVTRLMDEIAGNVSPAAAADSLQGERVTNGQVNFIADLQNEAKDAKIERFLVQFAALLSEMQRRAASPDCTDEDAREFRARCLEVMSEEEIAALANHPAAGTVEDFTDQQRQVIIQTCTELAGNPLVDQREALFRKLAAAVDADFAKALLLADQDPTVIVEQTRTQALENVLLQLQKGALCQPSPRDNHIIHLDTLLKEAANVAKSVAQDPSNAIVLKEFLDHGTAHVQAAQKQGVPESQLASYVKQLMQIQQGIQVVAQAAQQQVAAQQGQPAQPAQPAQPVPAAA